MFSKMFAFESVLCLCSILGLINGSAIPMWEFLSKQEKMSYLYSMFANQVEKYCDVSSMENCNQELLKYGLAQLKTMSEESLDSMDPYQRGANNIIWESMMKGHAMMQSSSKPRSTTTSKPNSYDDEAFGDSYEFGAQGSASAKIDNVYVVPPPKDFVLKLDSGKPQYTYPQNVASYLNAFNKPESKGIFSRFQSQYHPVAVTTEKSFESSVPLTGPMVVRVYPDGTPVREATQVHQDEDLRQYKLSKVVLPNL